MGAGKGRRQAIWSAGVREGGAGETDHQERQTATVVEGHGLCREGLMRNHYDVWHPLGRLQVPSHLRGVSSSS